MLRAVRVRMCAVRTRIVKQVQYHKQFSPSSRRTTVESNMKVSIIYTWLVNTLSTTFALSLVLFLPCWLPQNTYIAEDQSRCPLHSPLSRSAVLPCSRPPSSVHVLTHEFLSVHVSANKCKWVQMDIPERDRHIRTYARTLLASFPGYCAWADESLGTRLVHCEIEPRANALGNCDGLQIFDFWQLC